MKLLVVDDDPTLRNLLGIQLREMGHQAVLCASAEEALGRLDQESDCDLVLTDVRMPGKSGIDFLRELQTRPLAPPVAIMSGKADLSMAIEAMRLRAIDFLLKPFGRAAIHDLLTRAVAMSAAEESHTDEALPIVEDAYSVVMPTSRDWIAGLCRQLLRILEGRLAKQELGHLRLAIHEALYNAVIHGNLQVSSELKDSDDWTGYEALVQQKSADPALAKKRVKVDMRVRENAVELGIEDEGPGFDPDSLPDPDDPEAMLMSSGRGLMLIRYAMDAVRWNDGGNRIEMRKDFTPFA